MIGVDVVDMEVGGLGAGLARRGLGRLAASLKAGPCALRADTLAPFGWSFALAHTVSTDDPLHARVARGLEHAQVPSRAGRTNSSSFFGSATGTGAATCRTYVAPTVALPQPASELRSVSTNSTSAAFGAIFPMLPRTASAFPRLRSCGRPSRRTAAERYRSPRYSRTLRSQGRGRAWNWPRWFPP